MMHAGGQKSNANYENVKSETFLYCFVSCSMSARHKSNTNFGNLVYD